MFLLYAIGLGLLIGLALRGRPAGLAGLEFQWAPLAIGGFAVQIALFSGPISDRVGDFGPAIYVASTASVLVAVLRNVRVSGLALVAAGAASNLAAIVANGGWMPADPAALASIGGLPAGYTNSEVVEHAALLPLTDLFAMPSWLPLANIFSVGDVLIGVGTAATIALAMRARPRPGAVTAGVASAGETRPEVVD
jgi:hypothetical protein